jgi:arginase
LQIQLIHVPYDSGHKSVRCGIGPDHFLQNGVDQILKKEGHEVEVQNIEVNTTFVTEIGTTFEIIKLIATSVNSGICNKKFPIVLSGNCNSCLGTIAGIQSENLGVIWFDAHGDFNTPETTESGFLDGMGLAISAGLCWRSLVKTIPNFIAVEPKKILHIGSRDLDAKEEKLLEKVGAQLISGRSLIERDIFEELRINLQKLRTNCSEIYLHIDMDVLDSGEAQANYLPVPGGLSCEAVEEMVKIIREDFNLRACCIASFDPTYDKDDRVLNDGVRLLKAFVSENS